MGEVSLSVAEAGEGGRPLLLLHGFSGKVDFTPWLDDLPTAASTPSPLTIGATAKRQARRRGGVLARPVRVDTLALADALGFDRSSTWSGHSMGGMVAQHVVLSAPDRVESLVLMDTGHGTVEMDAELAAWGLGTGAVGGIDALADVLVAIEGPLHTEAYQRLIDAHPDHAAFSERKLRASRPRCTPPWATAPLSDHDRLKSVSSFSMPTLVVVGDEDAPFLGPSARLAATIPDRPPRHPRRGRPFAASSDRAAWEQRCSASWVSRRHDGRVGEGICRRGSVPCRATAASWRSRR